MAKNVENSNISNFNNSIRHVHHKTTSYAKEASVAWPRLLDHRKDALHFIWLFLMKNFLLCTLEVFDLLILI